MSLSLLVAIALIPLLTAAIAGLGATGFLSSRITKRGAHALTIAGLGISFLLSAYVFYLVNFQGITVNETFFQWTLVGHRVFEVGFQIDALTSVMLVVVTFVSFCVHVYSIGYMDGEKGYSRFFAYISLFTFAMLMLVMANNMMQLFFGWEGVGLVSYLLIGFYYDRPSAIFANLKAFLLNRVGDFGFVIGIGLIYTVVGSLSYNEIFQSAMIAKMQAAVVPGTTWPLIPVACFCLFIGASAKSAQVPLHAWLPDSMEGPTPISALIHAATMVTAGIFMVTRFSPMFELSGWVLSFIIVIGAVGAFFLGLLGIIQQDIKRVIAYSTLSQLGYMTVALGASAYPIAIFHLMTHAFFKALLFLGAGSVIVGMHHDQDIRNMGGLWKKMPITYITFVIGTLALCGVPFFSGYYSKDLIIAAAGAAHETWGHTFAYYAVLGGVVVTAMYSFRLMFVVFHGKPRWENSPHLNGHHGHGDDHGHGHDDAHGHDDHGHHGEPKESPWVITLPLVLLAIPSLIIGAVAVKPFLIDHFFGNTITMAHHPEAFHHVVEEFHEAHASWLDFGLHGFTGLPFYLVLGTFIFCWYAFLINPKLPAWIKRKSGVIYTIMTNKYYFDWINENIIAPAARWVGRFFWLKGDKAVIDNGIIGGVTGAVSQAAQSSKRLQTGFIYSYAFAMIIGVFVFVSLSILAVILV